MAASCYGHYLDEDRSLLDVALARYYLQSQGTYEARAGVQPFISAVYAARKNWALDGAPTAAAEQR